MFNSIGAYFMFVIPATLLLALGIVYEPYLISFEELISNKVKEFLNVLLHRKQHKN